MQSTAPHGMSSCQAGCMSMDMEEPSDWSRLRQLMMADANMRSHLVACRAPHRSNLSRNGACSQIKFGTFLIATSSPLLPSLDCLRMWMRPHVDIKTRAFV